MKKAMIIPVGTVFVRLRIVGHTTINRRHRNSCVCECGKTTTVSNHDLLNGNSRSCGCLCLELRRLPKPGRRTHGDRRIGAGAPEYQVWINMKARCSNTSHKSFKDYGGRGITVCERWLSGDGRRSGYECFLEDMGRRPSPSHEIDRKKNNEGYFPENCRWATRQQQALNVRSNRLVEINGEALPVTEAHRKHGRGASLAAVWSRIWKGMDPAEAILTPPKYRPRTFV